MEQKRIFNRQYVCIWDDKKTNRRAEHGVGRWESLACQGAIQEMRIYVRASWEKYKNQSVYNQSYLKDSSVTLDGT
jgi:hypothetical protein